MVTSTNIPIGNKIKKSMMTKSKRGYLWVTDSICNYHNCALDIRMVCIPPRSGGTQPAN